MKRRLSPDTAPSIEQRDLVEIHRLAGVAGDPICDDPGSRAPWRAQATDAWGPNGCLVFQHHDHSFRLSRAYDSTSDEREAIDELEEESAALAARIETLDGVAPADYVDDLRDSLDEMDTWLEDSIDRPAPAPRSRTHSARSQTTANIIHP